MSMTWDDFKSCCQTQGNLDIEAWDVMLVEPLKDLYAWWHAQSDATKVFTIWLQAHAAKAFASWVAKVAGTTDAAVGAAFSEAIVAVTAGIAVGTFLDVIGRCTILDVEAS